MKKLNTDDVLSHANAENYRLTKENRLLRETLKDEHAYTRPKIKARPATGSTRLRIIIPDSHGNHIDEGAMSAFLADLKSLKCDKSTEIVMLGDHLDCGGWLAQHHVLGYVAEIGETSYVNDFKSANFFLDEIMSRANGATIHYIEGNHECVSVDTEVLTPIGWIKPDGLVKNQNVYAFDKSGDIREARISAISSKVANLVSVKGDFSDELVSESHRIFVDGKLDCVKNYIGKVRQTRFRYAGRAEPSGRYTPYTELSDDFLRLLVWVYADGCIWRSSENKVRIQFKLSRPDKIKKLQSLLTGLGIDFTFAKATRCATNVSQPYMIRIYGDSARNISSYFPDGKELGQWLYALSHDQVRVVIETILATDGSKHFNKGAFRTICERTAENFQVMCIRNNIPCKMNVKHDASGFENGKTQYILDFAHNGLWNRRYVEIKPAGVGEVFAIENNMGTLITRRNGKVSFTGNSRIEKWAVTYTQRNGGDAQMLIDKIGAEAVLNLNARGIKYYRIGEVHNVAGVRGVMKLGKCHFTHGFSTSKHAAASHSDRAGVNIVYGHTHRMDSWHNRTMAGSFGAWSPGCLSTLKPRWQHNNPTMWSHGYAVQIVDKDESFMHLNIPIIDGRSLFKPVFKTK